MKSFTIGLTFMFCHVVSAQHAGPEEDITDTNAYLGILNDSIEYYLAIPKMDSEGLYIELLRAWSDTTQDRVLNKKQTLTISQHLGTFLTLQGQYEAALIESKKALSLIEKDLNNNDLKYAEQLESVGMIYELLSNLDSALFYNQKSRKIKEKRLGYDHIQLASVYRNLGSNLSDAGLNDSALYYFHHARQLFER